MSTHTRERFVAKLTERYGAWSAQGARFGDTPYGRVAADLCISASQFSKLISGTATAGMYERSTRNVDQLIELVATRETLEQLALPPEADDQRHAAPPVARWLTVLLVGGTLLATALWIYGGRSPVSDRGGAAEGGGHPLAAFFDRTYNDQFLSPYLAPGDLVEFCPCAGYEGEWHLAREFVIPLPDKRPGLYYRAKAADVRMKCARSVADSMRGRVLYGFQYLDSELWVDKLRRPLSPEYFDPGTKTFTEAFYTIDFEGDPNFAKLADIRSAFLDHLSVYPDSIVRHGEPTGRFADNVDQDLADTYEIDPREVLKDVLGDMTATSCSSTANPFCDPNSLAEGRSELGFDCFFAVDNEHLGMGGGYPYHKALRLVRQSYADRLPCGCDAGERTTSDLADKSL